jgi:hypothetical protein
MSAKHPSTNVCFWHKAGAGVTKSSDKFLFDELRRANQQPAPPKREADLVPYNYYFVHPEHRPRKLTRQQLRRRLIREG